MTRRLAELENKHAGKECWVVGRGPSLDNIDPQSITGPRIYMNRTAFVLPASADETYWMVNDNTWLMGDGGMWNEYLEMVRNGCGVIGVFRNPMYVWKLGADGSFKMNWVETPAPAGDNIIYWDGSKPINPDALYYMREEVTQRNMLYSQRGSLCIAVHLAWYMGCEVIHMVGIDGTVGHAEIMKPQFREDELDVTNQRRNKYSPHKEVAMKAAKQLNMKVVDYS